VWSGVKGAVGVVGAEFIIFWYAFVYTGGVHYNSL